MPLQRPGPPARGPTDINRRISRDDMFLTSSSNRSAAASAFNKRISRDDMFLGMRPTASITTTATATPRKTSGDGKISGSFHIPLPRSASLSRRRLPTTEEYSPPGSSTFNFPTPTAVPSARLDTPDSHSSGDIPIGMALGSPAHPPAAIQMNALRVQSPSPEGSWPARESSLQDGLAPSSSSAAPVVVPVPTPAAAPIQRSKTTRRKLFGLFGGSKRHQESPEPVAISAGSRTADVVQAANSTRPAILEQQRSPLGRSSTKKYQPLIVPTAESDLALASDSYPSREAQSHSRPFLRAKASEPVMRTQPGPGSREKNNMTVPKIAASPFLNVEIPDVRLERYSVMFGNLLQPGQAPKESSDPSAAWQPASSLLARRQATLDRLKMINDKIVHEGMVREKAAANGLATLQPPRTLQRRATSPAKSPGFSLFPGRSPASGGNATPSTTVTTMSPAPDSGNNIGLALPSPRLRSYTAPDVSSPRAQHQQKQPMPRNINPLRGNPTMVFGPPKRAATVTASQPMRSVHFNVTESSLILDSPTDMVESPGEPAGLSPPPAKPFKPVLEEPQWSMVVPSSTTSPSSAGSGTSVSSGSGSSTTSSSTTNSTNSVPSSSRSNADNSVDNSAESKSSNTSGSDAVSEMERLQSAVEISIARQISVSRQQRELLRPLQTGYLGSSSNNSVAGSAGTSPGVASPSRVIRLGRNERLQETRSATPTLVLADTMSSGSGSHNKQPKHSEQDSDGSHKKKLLQQPSSRHNGSLTSLQIAQNRKSERVVLEAA